MEKSKTVKLILLFFIFVLLFLVGFFGIKISSGDQISFNGSYAGASLYDSAKEDYKVDTRQQGINGKTIKSKEVAKENEFNIEAESIISVRINPELIANIKFSKNEEEKLPVASLTKLMTALVVLENYDLNKKITVSKLAMAQEGEQGNLKLGEALSVKNLLYITLIESSNRAAYAISEDIGEDKFILLMNNYSEKLGLKNTHFQDSSGLNSKSYSTAMDLAKLSAYLFENYPLFREIISLKEFDLYLDNGQLHRKLISTNKFLGEVNGIIGGKTGWTSEAKGCFMVVEKNNGSSDYTIHIILGAEDRFLEMQKLINWVNSH